MRLKTNLTEITKNPMSKILAGVSSAHSCIKYGGTNGKGENCGCACAGPSSIQANGDANIAGGLVSPC